LCLKEPVWCLLKIAEVARSATPRSPDLSGRPAACGASRARERRASCMSRAVGVVVRAITVGSIGHRGAGMVATARSAGGQEARRCIEDVRHRRPRRTWRTGCAAGLPAANSCPRDTSGARGTGVDLRRGSAVGSSTTARSAVVSGSQLPSRLPTMEAGTDTLNRRSGSRIVRLKPGSSSTIEARPVFVRLTAHEDWSGR